MLNCLDGGLQLIEGHSHLIVGFLDFRRNLGQLLHLPLRVLHAAGHRLPDLVELPGGLVDIGKRGSQILKLCLKMVRLLQHAGKGVPHQIQLPEGSDLLLHQILLVFLQTARHVQNRVKAFHFLFSVRLLPVFSSK